MENTEIPVNKEAYLEELEGHTESLSFPECDIALSEDLLEAVFVSEAARKRGSEDFALEVEFLVRQALEIAERLDSSELSELSQDEELWAYGRMLWTEALSRQPCRSALSGLVTERNSLETARSRLEEFLSRAEAVISDAERQGRFSDDEYLYVFALFAVYCRFQGRTVT